ncbi:ABC transporter, fused permease protein [hydrothermal vent metagenome]|uniref:ABC transporter, fused permease protein n=1 Tax=hydrothermal vent metagenome TaxID=652676 RepID=A0A3B0SV28_9ZZZZ
MTALNRKLWRDLAHIWPQALAIALVMAAGVATLILAQGAYQSLFETREAYYERYRFADVFASAKRAPQALVAEIERIPGVAAAEGRVLGSALLDMPAMMEPATAQLVSLPENGPPRLNVLFIRKGRLPNAWVRDEVAVSNAFAVAHGLELGATIKAVMGGHARQLKVVGIADSPEFIYTLGFGELMPDDRRTAILWMPRPELAAAFDLDGAFNNVTVKRLRGAGEAEIIDRLDALLKPYGGRGAYRRKDQLSNAFINSELNALRAMSVVLPPIFLAVAAFLINMTLARMIAMEREQIGLLKALGYGNAAIGWHYVKFALVIAVLGLVMGGLGGWWMGRGLTELYGDFFKFPFLYFTRSPEPYIISTIVALAATSLGAVMAVGKAVRLAPAVAMQPPAPPRYRRLAPGLVPYLPKISQLSMMIVRQLVRWPVRAALTTLGVSLSIAILLSSLFFYDAIEYMIDITFFQADRQDATIMFTEPRPLSVIQAVGALPGVMVVEPRRVVSIHIRNGNIERRTTLTGKPPRTDLSRVLDGNLTVVRPDAAGVILAAKLAEVLGVAAGDRVEIEVLEGRGHTYDLPVVDINTSYIGMGALMEFEALNALLLDGPLVSSVDISIDAAKQDRLYAAIKTVPSLSGIGLQKKALANFRATLAENINLMTTVYLVLAGLIAFGVVYNTARIRLSERGRELASLRVLGFTRSEIYWVLFGEFVILVLAAVPLGWVLGYGLAYTVIQGFDSELYQIPLVILPATYAKASLVVLAAAAVSAVLLRLRTDRLDLIAVLKTRE